jgi:hypothetical protein
MTADVYSVSLLILFLDRLDKPEDTPLIEAMIVTLLAGQNKTGGWGYDCQQAFTAQELKAIADEAADKERKLSTSRDLYKLPAKGKRVATELPKVLQDKLVLIAKLGGSEQRGMVGIGDNSNTQFATLALWAGRRYGVPTQPALANVYRRFQLSQNPDGTWDYSPVFGTSGVPSVRSASMASAAMTCAGLLGLACGHGAKADVKKDKEKDGPTTVDLSGDARVKAGLQALTTAVGSPVGWNGDGDAPEGVLSAKDRAFYYLWSLERICVILGLETLGKHDWYNWGAEILLKNQQLDGTWHGTHAGSGADTCFALMFLKKANLARDLTGTLKGAKDPGLRKLSSGGVGGGGLKGVKPLKPLDTDNKAENEGKGKPAVKAEKKPLTEKERAAAKLTGDLLGAKGKERDEVLKELRKAKGGEYTEALAAVIPKLEAESKKLAREALADRLTGMKVTTLKAYFKEPDPEVRRAAALAAGQKDARVLIPELIDLLDDDEALVQRAARASLKAMAGKDLGDKQPPWREWWKRQAKE